jgi:hypothetical protein
MTDRACQDCTRRHETGNPQAPLQCRALPPVQGVARDAAFPTVRGNDYCHTYFEFDAGAEAARAKATAEAAAKLDPELKALFAPVRTAAGLPLNPPAGDLSAALVTPNEITPAESAKPAKRARRAPPTSDDGQLL